MNIEVVLRKFNTSGYREKNIKEKRLIESHDTRIKPIVIHAMESVL